jgi:diacylglycerol kinase family enzyme
VRHIATRAGTRTFDLIRELAPAQLAWEHQRGVDASPLTPGSDVATRPSLWARIAAVIALLAPVAMAVLAAIALAGDVPVAVFAVALLLLCSAAIWTALTRRGPRRAAGGALAALSAIGLIVLLAANWQGVVVFVALLLLLAVFGVAARYALGRSERTAAGRVAGRVVPAGAAGAAVLIINLKSGGGKAERFDLAAQARQRGVEPVVLQPGDDLLELAESAIARGAQVIGMAGGDGSQALVATVAARRDVAHVCIPAGTRNHFALDLGLDREDVVGALDAFTEGVERRIDLARVNDRVFVNNASLGVYAKVVQSDAYRDAKLETWTAMLPDLLGPEATSLDLEFTAPDGSSCDDAPLVLVSNNPYRLTSLAGAGTRERIDSGRLGVVAARVRNAADVSQFVALELVGQVGRFPGLLSWSTREFEVRSAAPVEVGLDGEALVLDPPLRFASLPGALRVRLPSGVGLPPGARAAALTTANLGALLRVASGR